MRKFVAILCAFCFVVVLARAVVNPADFGAIPIIEVLQNLQSMEIPYEDMVDVFTEEFNQIAEILDTVIGDWGGADGILDYLRVIGIGLLGAIRALYAVFLAPFTFLFYTISTIVEVLRISSALLYG